MKKMSEKNQQIFLLCEKIFREVIEEDQQFLLQIGDILSFKQVFYRLARENKRNYSMRKSDLKVNCYIITLKSYKIVADSLIESDFFGKKINFCGKMYADCKKIVAELKFKEFCVYKTEESEELKKYLLLLGKNMTPKREFSVNLEVEDSNEVIIRRIL